MSDAQNLNDFFAQNSKKKKQKKPAPKAQPAAAAAEEETKAVEETVPAQNSSAAATAQPEPQPAPAQDYADSSDDEGNLVVANKEIIERKDLEAKNNKKEEAGDLSAGWGLGTKLGQSAEQQAEPSTSFGAPAKGPPTFTGGKMAFGKPMFSRKQKGIIDQQDFPDLDDASVARGKGDPNDNRAAGPMMFGSGSTAKGPRDPAPAEETKAKTKPVFKGKAKLFTTEGSTTNEATPSSMNYDFSRMKMSAATTGKRPEGEAGAGDGERRGPPRKEGSGAFDEDDGFEVVQEKKPRQKPRGFDGESAFGGGMPSFTRGGNNRQN